MTNYIPILRWKQGELTALENIPDARKTGIKPLLVLGADQFKEKKATKNQAAIPPVANIVNRAKAIFSSAPFYLDASALPVKDGNHPITEIHAQAADNNLQLIPSATLAAPIEYLTAIHEINNSEQTGAALRVDFQELSTADQWADEWITPLDVTDLIADFADNMETAMARIPDIEKSFKNLHRGSDWRSVTIAGTSIPETFQGYDAGTHLITRHEKLLWDHLSRLGLQYEIGYGDYANISLSVPPPGIRWGFPINVKYTLEDKFLICRGVKTTGRGAKELGEQLHAHALTIKGYPERDPINNCWGDIKINEISNGGQTGNLATWVGYTVNRHVEYTKQQLG